MTDSSLLKKLISNEHVVILSVIISTLKTSRELLKEEKNQQPALSNTQKYHKDFGWSSDHVSVLSMTLLSILNSPHYKMFSSMTAFFFIYSLSIHNKTLCFLVLVCVPIFLAVACASQNQFQQIHIPEKYVFDTTTLFQTFCWKRKYLWVFDFYTYAHTHTHSEKERAYLILMISA